MSKPISISLGKPKTKPSAPSGPASAPPRLKKPAFTADPEDEDDEQPPTHEAVVGFAADGGAILSTPVRRKGERVIENQGNADWRTRGRPAPATQRQQPDGGENGTTLSEAVERVETSKKAGLQLAEDKNILKATTATTTTTINGHHSSDTKPSSPPQSADADASALSALINGHQTSSNTTTTTTTIEQTPHLPPGPDSSYYKPTGDETLDFRADVATRPDPSTLDEYAAMPVEEFGMALLRGMGKKRRANGEVIVIKNPNEPDTEEERKKREREKTLRDPNAGYLGIGAKAVKIGRGAVGGEGGRGRGGGGQAGEDDLGAWGKADMRRNKKGEGLYTPVMLRDRRTGELISEKELERRKREAKDRNGGKGGEGGGEDWRERRDRNGQGDHDEGGDERATPKRALNGSSRKLIENGEKHSLPPPSSSTRRRSRSRHRERDRDSHGHSDRDGDRPRDKYRADYDDKRRYHPSYSSSAPSSRRDEHDRDGRSDRDRDRDRGSDRRRER